MCLGNARGFSRVNHEQFARIRFCSLLHQASSAGSPSSSFQRGSSSGSIKRYKRKCRRDLNGCKGKNQAAGGLTILNLHPHCFWLHIWLHFEKGPPLDGVDSFLFNV